MDEDESGYRGADWPIPPFLIGFALMVLFYFLYQGGLN